MSERKEVQAISRSNTDAKKGTKRNFTTICVGYVCALTSFNAVTNLQSSINTDQDVGLYSLAIMYGAALVSALCVATPIGYISGYKWSIVAGQVGIMLYVASNIYPKAWLMFSTAIICGILRACLEMAHNAYISLLAASNDDNNGGDTKAEKYFSIFLAAFQSAGIWGNLISYLVLRNAKQSAATNVEQCGASFLTKEHQNDEESSHISATTIYILFSILAGVIFLSVVLVICLLDQKRDDQKDNSKSVWQKSVNHAFSTLKTMAQPSHLILFPLGFWTVSSETFFMGAFTNSFITCTVGIQYVGLIMTVYGITATISSIIVAFVAKLKYGRVVCFAIASVCSYVVFIFLLLWKPTPSATYLLFILPCLSSIADGITEPFITVMYDKTFPKKKDAAFSMLTLAQNTGCCIVFLYASMLRVRTQIILQLIYATVAMFSFIIVMIKQRGSSADPDDQQLSVLNNIVMMPSTNQELHD